MTSFPTPSAATCIHLPWEQLTTLASYFRYLFLKTCILVAGAMMLKENETLFQEFKWTVSGDAKSPDSDVKVVSPYFSLNTSVGDSNTFRFAIRLLAKSGTFDKFQAAVYCYVHNVHKLGIKVNRVQCVIIGETFPLHLKVEGNVIKIFKSEEFLTHNRLSEKGFSLKCRLHLTNISDQPFGYLGYELRDTCFGDEIWLAAQKGFMTDCEFVVDKETFQVHKAIVASRCPVLAERIGNENNNRIEIRDFSNPVVFKAMLHFLYTGKILPLNSSKQLLFVDLVTNYRVKMAEQIHEVFERGSQPVAHHSEDFSKIILDLQSKLKYNINIKIK